MRSPECAAAAIYPESSLKIARRAVSTKALRLVELTLTQIQNVRSEVSHLDLVCACEAARIVFHADDPNPISAVTAQISFSPPDTETFKITDAQGSPNGKKIISAVLEQEVVSAKEGHQRDISRSNYEFVFLREQDFGFVPEYVLHITPKRKEKGLLLGDIWVDAKTYRIRQIIEIPLKTPSFWVKNLHITVQFAAVNDMWIAVSLDAIAAVRFLGIYTLAGHNLAPPVAVASTPSRRSSLCFSTGVLYRTSLHVREHIVRATVIVKAGIAAWRLPICTLQIVS